MDINHQEKSGSTVSVHQADPSAIVDFVIDIHNSFIGQTGTGIVEHRQEDAGHYLCYQEDQREETKISGVGGISGGQIKKSSNFC